MNISETGLRLIKEFEGLRTTLYNDPVGHCTVGIGHLVHLGPCDRRAEEAPFLKGITEEEALDLLRTDVTKYEAYVEQYVHVPLGQHQFDALVSLCYNIGGGGLSKSTVAAVLNERRYDAVCTELRKYVYGVGNPNPLPGLIRRREAECALFNQPDSIEEEDVEMPVPWVRQSEPPRRSYIIVAGKKIHVTSAEQEQAFQKAGYIVGPEKSMATAELKAIPSAPGTPEPDAR